MVNPVDGGFYQKLTYFLKNFLTIKGINKPNLYAKFWTDWLEIVENRSDSKSISDSGIGVMGKYPWPF